ncbi:MAG: hypothetical protein HQ546_03130, partial [Planctomycetes bacterium]|nr:hypothetical protein [Planctomycetota bacterium]
MSGLESKLDNDHTARRTRTFFVDWNDLEAKMTTSGNGRNVIGADNASPRGSRRILRSVEAEVEPVRRNVKDAAEAVLTWVAAVMDGHNKTNLNDVLDRCLRPGPDVERVNYEAMAKEITRTIGVPISAKRVRTAISHLRDCNTKRAPDMNQPVLKEKLDALQHRLEANYSALTDAKVDIDGGLQRSIAVEVLGSVRAAAGHLIENSYGEGIPQEVDIDWLEGRFLDFVRQMVQSGPASDKSTPLASDLRQLLVILGDYDQSIECNMRLVVDGSRVVADLMGPDSLCGLMAQLNVLVAGRYLLDTELYCAELSRLAADAAALRDDAETKSFMNWVRRLSEDQRLPSPIRVSSYCLNNAATHILERLYLDQWCGEEADQWLKEADRCLDEMRSSDSGFRLIATTQVIYLTVVAKLTADPGKIRAMFTSLGRS